MALRPCKSCKKTVDTNAKNCPNCGVKNPGLTTGQKVFRLMTLLLIIAEVVSMSSVARNESTPESATNQTAPTTVLQPAYSITKDDFREGRPRKVEVMLPKRLNEADLVDVAKAIRANTKIKADKTFIGFRVEGQSESTYWANVSFDPDIRISFYGLRVEDYARLKALDLKAYPNRLGSWLRDGALGNLMVLYKLGDKYLIDSIFPSGGKNTVKYVAKELPDGGLRLDDPESDFNEHYVVDSKGNLQGWGENGVYMTLPSFKPAQ